MGHGSSILSSLLFLVSVLYISWGVHVFRISPNQGVNKAFLATSVALWLWSFGYSMMILASSLESALFWARFSAIGKMSLFSIVTHFMLLLVNKDASVKQRKLFMLIHIPAIVFIYIFVFSHTIAPIQYNIIKTAYGWINIPVYSVWSFLFYLYYILCLVSSFIIIVKWKERFEDKSITRLTNLFFITFIATIILGTFTDTLASLIFKIPFPQIAPLFILFPVWTMYQAVRYYNVLDIKSAEKEESFISSVQKNKIFIIFSIGLFISGILASVFEYFSPVSEGSGDFKALLTKSGTMFIVGISIIFIQKIKKESLKEALTSVVLLLSVPIVTLQFLNHTIITVWVYPIIIITISALLFNNITWLITTTIVAIITQKIVWIIKPGSYVLADQHDFIFKIIIFIAVFFLSSYINKTYIAKIKEKGYQIAFQKMVSDISFDFISLNQENINEKVNNLLMRAGTFFQVDRTYLFIINYQDATIACSNEWCNTGINKETKTFKDVPMKIFPWGINQFKRNKLIYIENVERMSKEANLEKKQLLARMVKSIVVIPIFIDGDIQGYFGADSILSTKKWADEDIKRLNIIGNLLSSGIRQNKLDREIEFMAYYDYLTKLPNRFLFTERFNQEILISKQTEKLIGIIRIDLDNFKLANIAIGHRGTDILIKKIAKALVNKFQKTDDVVARFGGDEFLVMVNDIADYNLITKITDEVIKVFSDTFTVNGEEFLITASAGSVVYPVDGEDLDTLLKHAGIAMNKAKATGKNRYALFTHKMREEMQTNTELSNDLYRALERNELIVYYQPQVDLSTNKITGVEALARWMHPTKGMIFPGVFIPLAEENSLINPIGEWVLKTACIQNKKWQDMGLSHIDMAVNLSAAQIINPRIAENIENIIKETGIDPQYIELEITESIAIREIDYVTGVLNKLKKIGVSIAIDDFGTKHSSLSRLEELPVERLKIDMQFVQGIETSKKDKTIVMVIIILAKNLGLNVLAEGVETESQLEFLKQKKCDYVQGYYYHKPMPAKEIEKILRNHQYKQKDRPKTCCSSEF